LRKTRIAIKTSIAIGMSLLLASSASLLAYGKDFSVPRLQGPVNDQARILSPQVRQSLTQALYTLKAQIQTEVAVLTLPNLGGVPIEDASIRIVENWQLGSQERGNGILFLIAQEERQMRIEVGQGLEGELTDVESKRIIDDHVRPLFQSNRFDEGVLIGVVSIVQKVEPELDFVSILKGQGLQVRSGSARSGGSAGIQLVLLMIILFIVPMIQGLSIGRGRRSGRVYGGYGWRWIRRWIRRWRLGQKRGRFWCRWLWSRRWWF
jgi:uncharacterized protein